MSKLNDFFHAIQTFFSTTVWEFIKPFILSLEHDGAPILIAAAEKAVAVGFSTPGDGAAKMAAALTSFSSEIVTKGLPFMESQARALIELALQKAKVSL